MIQDEILRAANGKAAVVTGGTGMIGREVVRLLCDAGAHVRSVSLDKIDSIDPRAEQVFGDLTNFDLCRELTRDTDWVLHVAGIKGSIEVTKSKPASFFVPLIMMNTNLLEAARRNGCERVVYTSSIGAYSSAEIFVETDHDPGEPPMDMFPGWAKRMAEMQVEAYHIQYGLENFAVVRPCNVYGPGDNFDPKNAMVVPSLTEILISLPSKGEGISALTLSVTTSTRGSSFLTKSPSFLSHRSTVPSVTDSPSCGILIGDTPIGGLL